MENKLAGQDEMLQALRDQVTLVNNLAGNRSALIFARDTERNYFQHHFAPHSRELSPKHTRHVTTKAPS